ncbi:ABC transporter permease [Psychrobacillus psychrodurans]|uniref:ABC transporter permease n=1 Tax=Psychrobacillus psychrodurans TaxID=126157 RepID=UPI0008E2FD20|nr:ABC transporter permease [Psychrobacillus psychrodurans]MCZ8541144.1 ABC transporter permease [Psychrobacillus psychrodurans]SFM86980.1 ABC-2 type transport system permease protein [Psychrobacillus psychrodurans]
MLFSLIIKQMKMLIRNKQPLIILLVMPLVLITILSNALGSMMDGGEEVAIQANLLIVDDSSWVQEEEAIKLFLEQEGVTGPPMDALLSQFKNSDPVELLKNTILTSDEMKKYIATDYKQTVDLKVTRQDKNIDGILSIPSNFRLNYIKSVYFNNADFAELSLYLNQDNDIRASIIESVLADWKSGYTQSAALLDVGLSPEKVMSSVNSVEKIEQVLESNERKIPASIYYTVGMLVMFALYIPAFLAGFALQEVQWKVYDRILLAGVSPILYTLSIFFTGTLVAFIQQAIMLLFGMFVLGIEWISLEGMTVIVISYSVFVGALSALMTTLQFRTKTEGIANVFNGIFITVFSFLGGSFFNIRDISEILGKIGDLTPNGATMSAILSIQKGQDLSVIWPFMFAIYLLVVVCVLLSIVFFPRRGVTE